LKIIIHPNYFLYFTVNFFIRLRRKQTYFLSKLIYFLKTLNFNLFPEKDLILFGQIQFADGFGVSRDGGLVPG